MQPIHLDDDKILLPPNRPRPGVVSPDSSESDTVPSPSNHQPGGSPRETNDRLDVLLRALEDHDCVCNICGRGERIPIYTEWGATQRFHEHCNPITEVNIVLKKDQEKPWRVAILANAILIIIPSIKLNISVASRRAADVLLRDMLATLLEHNPEHVTIQHNEEERSIGLINTIDSSDTRTAVITIARWKLWAPARRSLICIGTSHNFAIVDEIAHISEA